MSEPGASQRHRRACALSVGVIYTGTFIWCMGLLERPRGIVLHETGHDGCFLGDLNALINSQFLPWVLISLAGVEDVVSEGLDPEQLLSN